ncbi:DUF2244 domain-containing protein [Inmirania thermothiophila]|uniref:Putative membrane protein n=1 Tax=Inmirania thermothiophila TaxID=1750597 RepID=A0A3N1Y2N9_9GAMM|nr:DUF2244 domain-containing protein [Inmirania thermothiophila]ROR32778.1 putative membrane protein [Inmirania thermothiophila]
MVETTRGPDGLRLVLAPRPAPGPGAWLLGLALPGAALAGIGAWFAARGAWAVLPFAGLELALLAWAMASCARAAAAREVVEVTAREVVVRDGRGAARRLPRAWARVVLRRDPAGRYPSRLFLRAHGREVELGRALPQAERARLAGTLAGNVGAGWSHG